MDVIDQIPAGSVSTSSNAGSPIDDDVVVSHGNNLVEDSRGVWRLKQANWNSHSFTSNALEILFLILIGLSLIIIRHQQKRRYYMLIDELEVTKDKLKRVETAVESLGSEV